MQQETTIMETMQKRDSEHNGNEKIRLVDATLKGSPL